MEAMPVNRRIITIEPLVFAAAAFLAAAWLLCR